ncbi:outer membrane beta-barrel protein [Olivibacter sitiensis]|uniref:outer membrane beta-barrel protein n=1 Tax=Olivibacter sitiensis TaxID=376470 RepID=UPI0004014F6A|nr:outer membrane beta-barrel protein [Olivibacter sitiensis]
MKKLLLTAVAALAISFGAKAQTEQGKIILGGSVGYSYDHLNGSDANTQSFNVTPNIGYFISDNFAIGTRVGYAYRQEKDGEIKDKWGSFVAVPFARKYSGTETFKFFGELSVPMAWGTVKNDGTKVASTANYGVQLSPGVAFFPKSNFGIELSVRGLYYGNDRFTNEITGGKSISNSFGLASNFFSPQLGVQFYF